MVPGYRSDDAVITICQNNRAKSIEISDVNNVAEEMTGYSNDSLKGKALKDILPPRIAEMLTEYVEFEDNANDVGEVLSRVQSFSILGKDGKEASYRMKVVRSDSATDTIFFKLVLHDKAGLRKNEALRKAIQDSFKGHESLDPDMYLPDKASLGKDIELMGHYNHKSELRSSFAILQLDHYDDLFAQYGRGVCLAMMKHAAFICRQSLRPDDVVGSINYKRLGVLLLDTSSDSARMAYNRLRWQIAANPFTLPDRSSLGLSVSMSFCRIGGRVSDKTILDSCNEALSALGAGAVNALVEVEEASKMQG